MATAMRRTTRQRTAVLAALSLADDFVSAQELHARLRASGEAVGLSTVYRTLQAMAGSNDIDVIVTAEGEARYRACAPSRIGHHHHLVCRRCGRTVEVRNPELESWAAAVAEEHGFTEMSHTVEIFGICATCAG